MTPTYSIKDLELLSGIKAHTIRAWEQRYKVIEPKRTETNIRYYSDSDLRKLLNVSYLVLEGIKISQVACLELSDICSMVKELSANKCTYKAEVNALKVAMLNFDQEAFFTVFENAVDKYGIDKTLTEIIGEFLKEVGLLWQAEVITMPHEHFVSNLLKQKLYSILDQLNVPVKKDAKTYMLFLPAKELHEIGLLYIQYKLVKRGERVIFLGQNTPHNYLLDVYKKVPFHCLISIFTTHPHQSNVSDYINKLLNLFGNTSVKILLTGLQASQFKAEFGENNQVNIYQNVSQLCEKQDF